MTDRRGIDLFLCRLDLSERGLDPIQLAVSVKASRRIGSSAPSIYLQQIEEDKAVQLSPSTMDSILRTHAVTPGFYAPTISRASFKIAGQLC
jgi:hypothetical protein